MRVMNRIEVVGLLVAVVLLAATPAPAANPKYLVSADFVNVGDEPHAAGFWGIDIYQRYLTVSCRGLTPGASYAVVNGAGEGIAVFHAPQNGNGKVAVRVWTYPPVSAGIGVYRVDATGWVLVLEWGL